MRNLYIILAVVAAAGVGFVVLQTQGRAPTREAVDLGTLDDADLVAMAEGVTLGDPNAPVTILEFADYQCPACAYFANTVKPQVVAAYLESGLAKLVLHDLPGEAHPHAFLASRAAHCAGDQEAYWAFHDAAFRTQRGWSPERDPTGSFDGIAGELGLDRNAFRGCLQSDAHAERVTANKRLAERMGIFQTPTLLVNDGQGSTSRLSGFQFSDVQAAIDQIQGR